jgi:hypothetical protein
MNSNQSDDLPEGCFLSAALLRDAKERIKTIGLTLVPYVSERIVESQRTNRSVSDVDFQRTIDSVEFPKECNRVLEPPADRWRINVRGWDSNGQELGVVFYLPVRRNEPVVIVDFYFPLPDPLLDDELGVAAER